MGSTFYTELRTSAYVVQTQRDAFPGLAKDVTASKPCVTDVLANLEDDVMYEAV